MSVNWRNRQNGADIFVSTKNPSAPFGAEGFVVKDQQQPQLSLPQPLPQPLKPLPQQKNRMRIRMMIQQLPKPLLLHI